MNRKEEILQIACYQYFHNTYPELRGLLNYNLNNPRNEIDGRTAKLMGLQKGRPDMELNYKGKTYFIEFKLPPPYSTPPTEHQLSYHHLLTEHDFPTYIVRTLEEFKSLITILI